MEGMNIQVGKFNKEHPGNPASVGALMAFGNSNVSSEIYQNMPPLEVQGKGSTKFIEVTAYSAETNTEVLLHKLFDKVRE